MMNNMKDYVSNLSRELEIVEKNEMERPQMNNQ